MARRVRSSLSGMRIVDPLVGNVVGAPPRVTEPLDPLAGWRTWTRRPCGRTAGRPQLAARRSRSPCRVGEPPSVTATEAGVPGDDRRLGPVRETEFGEDGRDVVADRLHRQAQPFSDDSGGEPSGDEIEHVALAGGQLRKG